ncbi:hypothetical protein [Diaphorobacter ruginosibacter]|uniref:hypothetical protein n=1 Tax=Diaphorobacter ruginosibacter TaxID=1715720 RepID=UPI00333E7897
MMSPGVTRIAPYSRDAGRRAAAVKMVLAGAALAFLAGCATFGAGTPEEAVTKRADERWAAWVKRDYAKAYEYNTPGYRGTVPYEKFVTMRGKDVRILSGKVNKVTCSSADRCEAKIELKARSALMMRQSFPKEIVTFIDETWVFEDGQWWLFERI